MKRIYALLLSMAFVLAGCSQSSLSNKPLSQNSSPNLQVNFIDVGQADCILITIGEKAMLIDAGNNNDGDDVVKYIKGKGIQKLDIIVGTHPHEDHIGGMDDVINTFNIDKIIMPKSSHTSKTYKDVLTAIKNKNLTVSSAKPGQMYTLGEAKISLLGPAKDSYENLNNYSAVLKMTYGNNSFLFTGDMEKINEQEVLASGIDVKADVLKVAHHGSRTSSTSEFLKAVSPKYGIIQVGKDNDYKHPHTNILSRLNSMMTVYRTDLHGTITVNSDGTNLNIKTEK